MHCEDKMNDSSDQMRVWKKQGETQCFHNRGNNSRGPASEEEWKQPQKSIKCNVNKENRDSEEIGWSQL